MFDFFFLEFFIIKDGIKYKIYVDVNFFEGINLSVEFLDLKWEFY